MPNNDCDFEGVSEIPIRVFVLCSWEWLHKSKVEILNVEENILGEDVVTFKCPLCGKEHKSRRFG